ncbi:MAG TPA: galactitol-1-phosphate 5-dehydrogenase [Candidatus Limnocylindrales bacterium]|jgi:threonine dehydrogenase-like Zn-dependent dehydrogenase
MKALVFRGPGSMPLEERPEPAAGPGEVVVAVRASGICGSDVHGFTGSTGRRRVGVVMGHEAAGEIVAVGEGVRGRRPGDRVVFRSILACGVCDRCRHGQPNLCLDRTGLGMQLDGAYAERVVVPEAMVEALPDGLGFEDAALVEPLAVALHAVNLTPFDLLDEVAIVGAGSIGLLTLLAVRRRGAGRVVVTDRDPHRLEMARALGADVAIDVSAGDPVGAVLDATGGGGADAVFEAVGIAATVGQSIAVARPGGQVTWVGNSAPEVPLPMQQLVTRELTVRGAYAFVDEFAAAIDALATGWIDAHPLVERVAPLEEGEDLFRGLAAGSLPAVKVVLTPTVG